MATDYGFDPEEVPFQRVGDNTRQSVNNNEVNYALKATDILLSDKAKQVFSKGEKNKWSLDKILTELAIPKEQKALLLDLGITDREQLALELASKYGYSVEVKTQTEEVRPGNGAYDTFELNGDSFSKIDTYRKNGEKISKDEYWAAIDEYKKIEPIEDRPTRFYSDLTSPGGTNYTENELSTPLITPSIKGHAKFATDKGIGWFRSDDKAVGGEVKNVEGAFEDLDFDDEGRPIPAYSKAQKTVGGTPTKTRRILEVQSDLFQKGRGLYMLANNGVDQDSETGKWAPLNKDNPGANQFLQLLNKDNNWVTFFIKSIIQG